MLTIACVNWGNYQGRGVEYVETLFDMVRRNLLEGYKGQFVVYTDDVTQKYSQGIAVKPLPEGIDGWWNKLWVFKQEKAKTLLIDLDTVIVGSLDHIADYDGFAMLRDFYHPTKLQSSIVAWNGDYSYIWDEWVKAGKPCLVGGDQDWIESLGVSTAFWQDLYPGDFASYKAHNCSMIFPINTKVVVFHGKPRPHECGGWVKKVWKVGGGTAAELAVVGNVDHETILRHIERNEARGLPKLEIKPPHDRQAVIVGGGPSVADDLQEIAWRSSIGQDIFAVNGTLKYLADRDIEADYQVMVDAREENVEFVIPTNAQYLLASQVHPKVFDCVKATIWHSANGTPKDGLQIGGTTTVGLTAATIAYVLGYRTIHLYGFDSCYGSSHHAYEQKLNDNERLLEVSFGDEDFVCSPWMAQQARDFQVAIPELVKLGCEIVVHGKGLIPAIARSMQHRRIAADDRADAILSRLPNRTVVGAEIGVFAGDLSSRLLMNSDLTLYMVDSWKGDGEDYIGDSGDFHAGLEQRQQDFCMNLAKSNTRFAEDRAKIVHKESSEAAKDFADGSLDFVFIDADHGYQGCKRDLHAWWPKVKAGGLFCGHDYENTDFPKFGVKRAVDEFAQQYGLSVELGENFTWFITKDIYVSERGETAFCAV